MSEAGRGRCACRLAVPLRQAHAQRCNEKMPQQRAFQPRDGVVAACSAKQFHAALRPPPASRPLPRPLPASVTLRLL